MYIAGYKKIDGDVCIGGYEYLYEPTTLPCPFAATREFLVMAQREKIIRIDLSSPINKNTTRSNNRLEVFPVDGLKNVIAIEYDMKNDCVFWADIVNDTIGRQCLRNGTQEREILLETDLASVEGTFDLNIRM